MNYDAKYVSAEGGGWNNNVLWASHCVSAGRARVREFSGNPITVSWHLGQNIERNINEIPLALFLLSSPQPGPEPMLGWAQISEVWKMGLLVFWQSSSGQEEQCHLMFLESHSARKGRVSLNGDFSKETWDVPSRKLLCHLSSQRRIPSVSASLATITRPLSWWEGIGDN